MKRKLAVAAAAVMSLAALATVVPTALASDATPVFPGTLDRGYGTNGIGSVPASATDSDRLIDVALTARGQTYGVGTVRNGAEGMFALSRITRDGALDPTFGTGGTALLDIVPGSTDVARGVGVQLGQKIVISGQAKSLEPGANPADLDIYVARFNTNGTLDTTFANGGTLRINLSPGAPNPGGNFRTDQTYGLAVGPDGKIILVAVRGPDAVARPGRVDRDFAIIRLTRNGALDPTWAGNGIAIVDTLGPSNPADDTAGTTSNLNESPRQAIIEPNGRVVVGSYSEGSDGRASPRLLRFLSNGSLDSTFGTGGIATVAPDFFFPGAGPSSVTEFYDVAQQGSSYVVCGYGGPTPTAKVDALAARFGQNGQADSTFGTNGAVTIDLAGEEDRCRDLEVLGDQRILLSGSGVPPGQVSPLNIDAMLVVLNRNGGRASGFGNNGVLTTDFGGTADSHYGVQRTFDTTRAVVVGFKGGGTSTSSTSANPADDGRVVRYLSFRNFQP